MIANLKKGGWTMSLDILLMVFLVVVVFIGIVSFWYFAKDKNE